ncbi:MAG: ABC transporter substrate-binding protein, partial [Methylocella sp.]
MSGMLGRGGASPAPQAQTVPPSYQGEQIGSGPARVALILPMTQATGPSVVGASLRNAAELAWAEAGNNDITLLVKDDRSTPEGARAAAQEALSEGAELIIGPLFASSVREAGQV